MFIMYYQLHPFHGSKFIIINTNVQQRLLNDYTSPKCKTECSKQRFSKLISSFLRLAARCHYINQNVETWIFCRFLIDESHQ